MGFNLGILISGRGSNMVNIINASINHAIKSKVNIVISNKKDALGIIRAKKKKIKTVIIDDNNSKNEFEEKLSFYLKKANVNFLCLAGFMQILSSKFLKNWKGKIINIHPSLLPAFKGLNAQQKALEKKVKYVGATIHFVNSEVDSGEIIDQMAVRLSSKDDLTMVKKKILMLEHKLYIKVLKQLEMEFNVNGKQ